MNNQKLPKGWKEVELGRITECLDNKRIPITESKREKGNIPYYGANRQMGLIKDFIFNEKLLLLAEDGGSWGFNEKCAYVINGKSWVNNHAHVLRMKKNQIEIKFLESWLNFSDLTKYISGTTRGKLNQRVMNMIKVPLPPLPTQKAIVSILEKAEKLKQQRAETDKLTKEYLQSVFYEMILNKNKFEIKKLNDLCLKITDGVHFKPVYTNSGAPFISVVNVAKQFLSFDNCKFISKEDHKLYCKRCNPERNDILYTKVGATYGIASIVNTDREFSLYVSVCLIKPDHKKINTVYLKNLMNMPYIKNQADERIKGVGVPDLHLIEIKNFDIPSPPIPLQNKFAAIVEKVEALKENQAKSHQQIENLFNSLMQKAFKGELVK